MHSPHRLSKLRQAPVAPPAPFKPLPRLEIKRGDRISLRKIDAFFQRMNLLIEAYNAGGEASKVVAPEMPGFESKMAYQEGILRQLQESFTEFNDEFPEEYLEASPNYRACYEAWTDDLNLRLFGLHTPGLAPAVPSLASIIATMSTAKAKELLFILLRHTELTPAARLQDELRDLYPADDNSREAENFRRFFSAHSISYLGGVNSRNFQIRNGYGQLEVLKVANLFGKPRKIERRLREQLASDLVPIAAERLVTGTDRSGLTVTRVLIATTYCDGSLNQLQARQTLPDARLESACEKIEQMATLFLKLQAHGFMFPDAKLSNWLVNSQGQLCIADTKSIVFTDADGNYSSAIEGNHYRSLTYSNYFSPPEISSASKAKADEVHAFQLGSNLYAYLTSYEALRSAVIGGVLDFSFPIFASSQGMALKSLIERLMVVDPHRRLSVESAYRELHEITHPRQTLLFEQIAQKLGAGDTDLVMKAMLLPVIEADLAHVSSLERERQLDALDATLRGMGPVSLSSLLTRFQNLKRGSSDVFFDAFIPMILATSTSIDRRVKLVGDLAGILQPLKQDKPGLQALLHDLELYHMGTDDALMAAYCEEKKHLLDTATLQQRVECILELRHLFDEVLPDIKEVRRMIATLSAFMPKAAVFKSIAQISQAPFANRKILFMELQDALSEISPDAVGLDREKTCFDSLEKWGVNPQDEHMTQWISQQQQALHQRSLPEYLDHLQTLEQETDALLPYLKEQQFVLDALAILPDSALNRVIKKRLLDLASPYDRAAIISDLKKDVIAQLREQEEKLLFAKLQVLVMADPDPLMQTYMDDCRSSLSGVSQATMEEYSGVFLALIEKIKELTMPPAFSVSKLFIDLRSMRLSATDPVFDRWMIKQRHTLLGLPAEERVKGFRELSLLASTGIDTQLLFRRVMDGFRACAIGDDEQMNRFIQSKEAQLLATRPAERRAAVLALSEELHALQVDPGVREVKRIIDDYRHKAGGHVDSGKGKKAANIERALQQVPIEERQHFFQSRSKACLAVMDAMAVRRGRGFFSDKVPRTARGEIDVGKAAKPFQAFMRVKESLRPKDDVGHEAPKGRKPGLKS
jgi:hypothetical protein